MTEILLDAQGKRFRVVKRRDLPNGYTFVEEKSGQVVSPIDRGDYLLILREEDGMWLLVPKSVENT